MAASSISDYILISFLFPAVLLPRRVQGCQNSRGIIPIWVGVYIRVSSDYKSL